MAGFLVVGIALAVKSIPLGAVLLFVRRGDKAPAAIGLAFVAWTCSGRKRPSEIACDRSRSPARRRRDARRLDVARRIRVRVGGQLALERDRSLLGRAGDGARLALTNTLHAVGFHGVEVGSSSR